MEKHISKYEPDGDLISADGIPEHHYLSSLEIEKVYDQVVKIVVSLMFQEESKTLVSKIQNFPSIPAGLVAGKNHLSSVNFCCTSLLVADSPNISSLDLDMLETAYLLMEGTLLDIGSLDLECIEILVRTLYAQRVLYHEILDTNAESPNLYNQDDINPLLFFLIVYTCFLRWIDLSRTVFISNYLITVLSAPQQKIYHLRI